VKCWRADWRADVRTYNAFQEARKLLSRARVGVGLKGAEGGRRHTFLGKRYIRWGKSVIDLGGESNCPI